MTVNKPVFILVRPQMGENIGGAARAMLNFGLTDLRIVNPRDGWPSPAAAANSSGALDVMDVKIFNTLQKAVADLHYLFATTARPRDIAKEIFTPAAAVEETIKRSNEKIGYVFGPERTGLENDEIALCQAILTVPTNPDFSSLNIAQSVLLMAYEFSRTQNSTSLIAPAHDDPASQDKIEEMLTRLQTELESGQFFKTETLKPSMLRNIRAMVLRGNWSDQEVRTFHGIISALTGKK
jgi:tRNA/rRNA methyltransferase